MNANDVPWPVETRPGVHSSSGFRLPRDMVFVIPRGSCCLASFTTSWSEFDVNDDYVLFVFSYGDRRMSVGSRP